MGKETVLPKNIRQIGDIQGTDRICLEDYVTTYIRKKESQEDQGYLGIFLGEERKEDEYVYVFIRGILEVPQEELEDTQLSEYLKTEADKYFPGCRIQGCCIIGTYPAARMKRLTALFPEAGMLLYHLQEQEESLYRLTDGQYRRIRGYFIFYEQNPEMQEYLAQIFQEDHTEKEALPDNAIKSFREKVKEKGIQKNTGFLRLAGSFMVITILAVGAIAVNRVDEIRMIRELSGDVTLENEAVNEAVKEDVKEEVEVLKVWDEVNPVEYIMDPLIDENSEGISAAEQVSADLTDKTAGEIEGASALPGADAFWNDSYEDESAIEQNAGTPDTEDRESTEEVKSSVSMNDSTDEKGMNDSDKENMDTDLEPAAEVQMTENAVQTTSRQIQAVYVIRAGDTLADICNKYYGSLEVLEELCRINEISDANLVMPGQKIVLP